MKLVIAEKPSVARDIAKCIGATNQEDGYLEGNGYIVSWCIGHLVEFEQKKIPWTLDHLPLEMSEKLVVKPDTEDQFENLKALMSRNDVDSLICATDAGREGEAIFRYVYYAAGCNKPFERLWISSMTNEAIDKGFHNLKPGSDYDNLYDSAVARDHADKIVGLNSTRLFTLLYHQGKDTPVLSVGRVQSAALNMIVTRDLAIKNFKKTPFYKVKIKKDIEGTELEAVSEAYEEKSKAIDLAESVNGGTAKVISVKSENKKQNCPKLYDLTSLQMEANNRYGYTAQETLDCVQNLYEKYKLCTYPRTDAAYITDDMESEVSNLIDIVATLEVFKDMNIAHNIQACINNKKVSDHHAIIPTNNISQEKIEELPEKEKNVMMLIAVRLLAASNIPCEYTSTSIILECEGTEFKTSGKIIKEPGFKKIEAVLKQKNQEDEEPEKVLPSLKEGDLLESITSEISEGMTQPPKHYTEATLLRAMETAGADEISDEAERKGIGTTATRAAIIENILAKKYIERNKKNLIATDRGISLISILPEKLKSVSLTAEFEDGLIRISKGEQNKETFLKAIEEYIVEIINENKNIVIEESNNPFGEPQRIISGKCPHCGSDVIYGKSGAYCSGRCGIMLGRISGKVLSEQQMKDVLSGNKILIKGLKSKSGKEFDAYFIPGEVEEITYTSKEGEEKTGYQIHYEMEFPQAQAVGKCPRCGSDVLYGKSGAYCSGKCGIMLGRISGKVLTEQQIQDILSGKKILLQGLKTKSEKEYDAYFIPGEVEEITYTSKEGEKKTGYQIHYEMEFPQAQAIGKCPHCGSDVVYGKSGAYCSGKCGMFLSKINKTILSESQVKSLLEKKKILIKGLESKAGKKYDAYFIPEKIEEFTYTSQEGEAKTGYRYSFKMDFPKKPQNKKKGKK